MEKEPFKSSNVLVKWKERDAPSAGLCYVSSPENSISRLKTPDRLYTGWTCGPLQNSRNNCRSATNPSICDDLAKRRHLAATILRISCSASLIARDRPLNSPKEFC
ncbi:hypothetical protein PIB30_016177 [Stylosanthes scabra]|uniref:Uncharacterized protein n=1 Tax=Stylosanthes scabra TaxID=79078 RepID=A0ABU6U630_9FABA|nr:hypothetical protein [Stylosanthes scabra]